MSDIPRLHRIDDYINELVVYQFDICPMPKAMGQRLLLCDEMWMTANEQDLAIENIADKVNPIWNNTLEDGEHFEIIDKSILDELLHHNLFPRFYGNFQKHLVDYQIQDSKSLKIALDELCILGWEVCSGCGESSASYDGMYPLYGYSDYFYIKEPIEHYPINKWGLFYSFELTTKYVQLNQENNASIGNWFAKTVLTTKQAYVKLEKIYQEFCGHVKPYLSQ